jgi:hypothetical protein
VHASNTGVIQPAAGLGGLEPPKSGNSPSVRNFYFLSSKLNVRLILVYSHRLSLTGNGWRYLMAKNSNEGVVINRRFCGSKENRSPVLLWGTKYDRETRTQCLSQATGDLMQIPVFLAKLGLEVEIEEKK